MLANTTNVNKVKIEAETLAESLNQPHKAILDNFIVSITELSGFLGDAQTVKALSDYDKKSVANKGKCPLDNLCKTFPTQKELVRILLKGLYFIDYRSRYLFNST